VKKASSNLGDMVIIQNDERRLRAHFIKSIYELAWKNLS